MVAAGAVLILLSWLLPAYLTLRIVFDGAEREDVRGDRRVPLALALNWLAAWVIWFRPAGPLGPASQVLALLRRTVSYQTLTGWPLYAALCLLAGLGVGWLLRCVRIRRQKILFRPHGVSQRCRRTVLLLTAVAVLPLALSFWLGADGARQLTLQEVCRRERGVDADRSYVVVKNNGAWPNRPAELFLTTDPDEPRQYRARGLSAAPGGTDVIEENADVFLSISRSGGDTVYLMDGFGSVLDAVELPELPADTAYRRTASDWEVAELRSANPEQVAAPTFSAPGGFYDAAFDLTLRAGSGQEIFYTLDGSVPDEHAERYTAPIRVYDRSGEQNRWRSVQNVQEDYLSKDPVGREPVDKAFVVRAVAADASGARSEVVTQTYFIDQNEASSGLVISLTADPDELFGPDGIYVTGEAYDAWYAEKREAEAAGKAFDTEAPVPNYLLRGAESERAANLEIFEDGAPLLDQPVGIRVQGNSSRRSALKRFSVHSRAIYGATGLFGAELFPGKRTHAFLLRGGLDNAISHAAAEGRDVAVLRARPVRVFLNGEYWYDRYLAERYNGHYFSETFGVFKDNVELISIGSWSDASEAERTTYEAMIDAAAEHDMADPEAYAAFCSLADIQSYIDYACINVYLGNADSTEHANVCVWRTKVDEFTPFGDCRWRWALNDMDLLRKVNRVNGESTDAQINSFSAARDEKWKPLLSGGRLYEALKQSPDFRRQFVLTFMDLVNTTFSPARMEEILARYGQTLDGYDDGFFRDRAGYITRYMAEEFELTGTQATLTLTADEPAAGAVRLNTITPDLSSGAWTGQYYTDVPVTLTAEPAPGHAFDHWEVDGERMDASEIELQLQEGGTTVHAIFR